MFIWIWAIIPSYMLLLGTTRLLIFKNFSFLHVFFLLHIHYFQSIWHILVLLRRKLYFRHGFRPRKLISYEIYHIFSFLKHLFQHTCSLVFLHFPTYTFIPTYMFISFAKSFLPTRLFHPTRLFGTLEYVASKSHRCHTLSLFYKQRL